jgi:hypothetical protein
MGSPTNSGTSEFFLIARDPDGEYLEKVQQILAERGIEEYVETTRKPKAPDLTEPVDPFLEELGSLLPSRVQFVSDDRGESPFLVLEVDAAAAGGGQPRCECKCGLGMTCGGGGGGH